MRTYGSMGAVRGVANSTLQAKMMCQIDVRLRQNAVGVSQGQPGGHGVCYSAVVMGVRQLWSCPQSLRWSRGARCLWRCEKGE